jgi:poly[ADP-ribose] polymerase 16
MFEPEECKFQVLEILSNTSRRQMCNLRAELFMVAAGSPNAETCLMPFPSCFFDRATKKKRVEDLQRKIHQIPKLSQIDEFTKMDKDVWELLFWVFTNPLTIQPVTATREILDTWMTQTGLHITKINLKRTFLYAVVNPTPKPRFIEGKAKFGTKFAFHGSKLENFHSVVHRGLIAALNRRSVYGIGSYLTNAFNVSFEYSTNAVCAGWVNTEIGSQIRCVAICEFVDDPDLNSIKRTEFAGRPSFAIAGQESASTTYYVVAKDELIQLSHLIVMVGV